jgi:phosphoribosylcarboxyaminoimidazole (NCAIR) mutase
VPVLGVPVASRHRRTGLVDADAGQRSRRHTAIGETRATNALRVAMLAGDDEELSKALDAYRQQRHDVAAEATLPPQ